MEQLALEKTLKKFAFSFSNHFSKTLLHCKAAVVAVVAAVVTVAVVVTVVALRNLAHSNKQFFKQTSFTINKTFVGQVLRSAI